MAKQGEPLVINPPNLGVSSSPHVGYGEVRNMDIDDIAGVVRPNYSLSKESGTVVKTLPYWIQVDPNDSTRVFALDSAGRFYISTDSGDSWTEETGAATKDTGHGMLVWKNWVFICRDTKIDAYDIAGDAWTDDWQTIDSDLLWHPMIESTNDGKVYGGAGQYIFSIEENSGQTFDADNAATYTFTAQALDLPDNFRIKCLTELGNNLMIGTWQGTNVDDFRVANIFPWDRVSPSFLRPFILNDYGVHALVTKDDVMYAIAGIDGKVYASNGGQPGIIAKIPIYINSLQGGKSYTPFPGAIMVHRDKIYFGVGSSSAIAGSGVWSIKRTNKGTILNFENTISTTESGDTNPLQIGALASIDRERILVGWRDNTTYGIDRTSFTRYQSYLAFFESPYFQVGTIEAPMAYSMLEFYFAQKLAAGQGIKLEYRTSLGDSYTEIGTYSHSVAGGSTAIGAVLSHKITADITDAEFIQFRVSLDDSEFRALIAK